MEIQEKMKDFEENYEEMFENKKNEIIKLETRIEEIEFNLEKREIEKITLSEVIFYKFFCFNYFFLN